MSALTTALNDPQQDIDRMDRTQRGYNALMLAAQHDHPEVAKKLIDRGADTSLRTSSSVETKNDWSNVMVAAWYGSDKVRAS
jgi:ankyrin repeat protein